MRNTLHCKATIAIAISTTSALAEDGLDHFEKHIRPVLVDKCYACHSAAAAHAKKLKGGLQLDTRAGIRAGGESGPAVVPGKPQQSLLLSALRHESFEMPPSGNTNLLIKGDRSQRGPIVSRRFPLVLAGDTA